MKLLIMMIVSVLFAILALGIAQYIYERENGYTDDDIWDDLINEFEHRGKGDRR